MNTAARSPHIGVREEWLALHQEEALDAELPIVDAHHHLWDRPSGRYLFDDLLADTSGKHNIIGSVYVQCRSMFQESRADAFKTVGEVEFANGIAALSASGLYGHARLCAGIVAGADLSLGDAVRRVLAEMQDRAGPRLCGVRNTTAWHRDSGIVSNPNPPPAGLLSSSLFRQGVRALKDYGLALDVWAYHTQLGEVLDLSLANPELVIVLDHVGGPLGVREYANNRGLVFHEWRASLARLAECPNVRVKLGGLGMSIGGFDYHLKQKPPSSETLAVDWAPYILTVIELFGVERCMFESNFPVDKGMFSYGVLWNSFKRLVSDFNADERTLLFSKNAIDTYKLCI